MWIVGLGLAVVVLAPLLRRGFVLSYDMVFVPTYRLSGELLGVSEQLPRTVPVDALLALASRGLASDLLQKALLGSIFVLGAVGVGRLVPAEQTIGRVAAAVLYVWNAYVYERLLIGHWSLLVSYSVLPHVVAAAIAIRREHRGLPRFGLWIGATALMNPYGGLIAACAGAVIALAPPWRARYSAVARKAGTVLLFGLFVNLPWLVPALLRPSGLPSFGQEVKAFAARSDTVLGTGGSLLSLGGMWNTDLAPPGRGEFFWIPAFMVILGLSAWGWTRLRSRWPPFAWIALLALGSAGFFLAWGPKLPFIAPVYRWAAQYLPGGGVLRDSQKFLAPFALALSVGFGLGVEGATRWVGRRLAGLLGVVLVALPLALVPTLAWGLGGRMASMPYPRSWVEARRTMELDPTPGRVLVLPWHLHLSLAWNQERVVRNPSREFFSRPALISDHLELRSGRLPPETPSGARADRLVQAGGGMEPVARALGARYVLLLKEADWPSYRHRLDGLKPVLDAPELALYRVRGPIASAALRLPPSGPVYLADVLVAALLVAMAGAHIRERLAGRDGRGYSRFTRGEGT